MPDRPGKPKTPGEVLDGSLTAVMGVARACCAYHWWPRGLRAKIALIALLLLAVYVVACVVRTHSSGVWREVNDCVTTGDATYKILYRNDDFNPLLPWSGPTMTYQIVAVNPKDCTEERFRALDQQFRRDNAGAWSIVVEVYDDEKAAKAVRWMGTDEGLRERYDPVRCANPAYRAAAYQWEDEVVYRHHVGRFDHVDGVDEEFTLEGSGHYSEAYYSELEKNGDVESTASSSPTPLSRDKERKEQSVPTGRVKIVNRGTGTPARGDLGPFRIEPAGEFCKLRCQEHSQCLALADWATKQEYASKPPQERHQRFLGKRPDSNNPSMLWEIKSLGDGFWRITNRATGKCLEMRRDKNGCHAWQSPFRAGALEQQWRFELVE
jgi:hypothetical protein